MLVLLIARRVRYSLYLPLIPVSPARYSPGKTPRPIRSNRPTFKVYYSRNILLLYIVLKLFIFKTKG